MEPPWLVRVAAVSTTIHARSNRRAPTSFIMFKYVSPLFAAGCVLINRNQSSEPDRNGAAPGLPDRHLPVRVCRLLSAFFDIRGLASIAWIRQGRDGVRQAPR